MSLKAGRVGVNPADVDPIDGHISPSSMSGYTKEEADAKFETQTHAVSTYETKTEAAALQPKTLTVPISLLSGSKLTVEDTLKGLSDRSSINVSDFVTAEAPAVVDATNSYVEAIGNLVFFRLRITSITATAMDTVIATISEEYRPKKDLYMQGSSGFYVMETGSIKMITNQTNNTQVLNGFLMRK